MSNRLKHLSLTQFKEMKETTNLVIIPTGAIEANGPHLPLGLDTIVAEKLAELVANRIPAVIGPTLEVGESSSLYEFPGTLVIRPEHFKLYLEDICRSLIKWGFTDFLFINGHGRNVTIITQLVDTLHQFDRVRCAQVEVWQFIKYQSSNHSETADIGHFHGGEGGTSVMLHLAPELVDISQALNEPPGEPDAFPEILKYRKFSTQTKSSTIGNATLATAEKGRRLVEMAVERIEQFLKDEWKV
jgi:creatinine amidohydrolase